MSRNVFLLWIEEGRIRSAAQLKSAYRALVRKVHPDSAGASANVPAFIAIRSQYETALRSLEKSPVPEKNERPLAAGAAQGFDRAAFYRELQALFARGFPEPRRTEAGRRVYENSRSALIRMLGSWDPAYPDVFLGFERELLELWPGRRFHGSGGWFFRVLGDNVIIYHFTGMEYYRKTARSLYAMMQKDEKPNSCLRLAAFFDILIRDLEQGPAV